MGSARCQGADLHTSCLKCLGESHQMDRYKICRGFCPCLKEERDHRLKLLLMEAALRPQSESSPMDLAPGSSALVCCTVFYYSGVRDPRH